MSLDRVTIFKVKETAASFADFFRSVDANGRKLPDLKKLDIHADYQMDVQIEGVIGYKEHHSARTEDDISWISFINKSLEKAITFKSNNKLPCGAVGIKITKEGKSLYYALTFGIGAESFLEPDELVRDFGLRVAMNVGDKNNLKRVQTSIHEAVSTHSEKQISSGSSFPVFGINDEKEFLRAMAGSAKQEYDFIASFTGKDSISIKLNKESKIDWDNLIPRILILEEAYHKEDYLEQYKGYAKFHFETDPKRIAELDNILFKRIVEGEHANIHLAPPEFINMDSRSFSYRDDADAEHHDDLSLNDFLSSRRAFRKDSTIKSLKDQKICIWDTDTGIRISHWSAYKCIVAEVDLAQSTYILSMGQWKEVSGDLKKEVEDHLKTIAINNDTFLPADVFLWDPLAGKKVNGVASGENREEIYNQEAVKGDASLFLFDKSKVQVAAERIYEICDIFSTAQAMIHIKRLKEGSASITHLFLQARFYSEGFITEEPCRVSMHDHIKNNAGGRNVGAFLAAIPIDRKALIANNYKVIFCILCKQDNPSLKLLPFMAKYECMHSHKYITNALGMQCEIAFRKVRLGP
jgi:uncharacterized protein (TIGR04141 family)